VDVAIAIRFRGRLTEIKVIGGVSSKGEKLPASRLSKMTMRGLGRLRHFDRSS
jgi:hypothetical protein